MRRAVSFFVLGTVVVFLFGALGGDMSAGDRSAAESRFLFLPARQNLWVVDRVKGSVIFFKFPDNEDRPIQRSRSFQIDRTRFPRGKTRFVLSMRNLTSIMWIVNEESGDVQVLRYRRDGTFDADFRLQVADQFQ